MPFRARLLDGLDDGPRGLLVEGDAGIGKTAIWRSALGRRGGARLPRAALRRPSRPRRGCRSSASPTWPDPIADDFLAALPAPQRDALEVALVRRAGSGQPPDPMAVGAGFRALLVRARRGRARSCSPSTTCSGSTPRPRGRWRSPSRRLDGLPVGVLATVRTPLAEADPLGLERALGPSGCSACGWAAGHRRGARPDRVAARPRRTGARRSSSSRRRPTATRCSRSRSPVRSARRRRSRPARRCRSPRACARSWPAASRRLDPQARGALLVAAALSHPTRRARRARRVRRRAGRGRGERAAVPRGRPARVRAPAVRVGGLRARRRAAAAARCTRGSPSSSPSPRSACATSRSRPRAPDEDGRRRARGRRRVGARARGAWETAGELLEQARALTPAARPYAARARGVRAAEHHIHAGDRPRARALLEAILADAPPGPGAQRRAAPAGRDPLQRGRLRRRARGCSRRRSQHAREPALAAAIELDLCYVRCNRHGDIAGADAHADRALAHAAPRRATRRCSARRSRCA